MSILIDHADDSFWGDREPGAVLKGNFRVIVLYLEKNLCIYSKFNDCVLGWTSLLKTLILLGFL